MPIYFYLPREAHGFLSNFAWYGIEFDGLWFPTLEHCFQAQKFPGTDLAQAVRLAKTPRDAKALGQTRTATLRPDWEAVKDGIMLRALRKKFGTHQKLQQQLLATGNELLIEQSPTDFYWGCGADGSGKNRLGQLLMQVRSELSSQG